MAFPKDDPRRVLFFPQGRWNINSVEVDSCDVVRSFNAVHIQLFLYKDEKYTENLPLWVCDLQQDFNKNLRPKENSVLSSVVVVCVEEIDKAGNDVLSTRRSILSSVFYCLPPM